MRNIQYYFCVLVASVYMFCPNISAYAEDGMDVSNSIQGLWAAPDCRLPEELYFYSEHFQIKTDESARIQMTPVHILLKKKEYNVITIKDKQIPSRVLEDGVLQLVDVEAGTNFSQSWDDLPIIRYHEYMHCLDTELPQALEKLMTLSTKLDAVYPYCQYSISEDCRKNLFASYMPEDGETLSKTHILQILQDIKTIGAIGTASAASADLDTIANALLNVFDQDQSDDITIDEIQATQDLFQHPALSGPAQHQLKALLGTIHRFFPSLSIHLEDDPTL